MRVTVTPIAATPRVVSAADDITESLGLATAVADAAAQAELSARLGEGWSPHVEVAGLFDQHTSARQRRSGFGRGGTHDPSMPGLPAVQGCVRQRQGYGSAPCPVYVGPVAALAALTVTMPAVRSRAQSAHEVQAAVAPPGILEITPGPPLRASPALRRCPTRSVLISAAVRRRPRREAGDRTGYWRRAYSAFGNAPMGPR
jgi:hypothetical protein